MLASALTIARRNAALLMLSFINAGVTTIVPQRFFARAVPDAKQFWLAVTLLLGTVGAMAGVTLARRFRWRPAGGLYTLFVAAAVLLWVGLRVEALALYVALQIAVRTLVNYTTQDLDQRAAAMAGEGERTANDRIGTGLRFLGMLLGPLWFGLVPSTGWPLTVLLVTVTGVSMLSAQALRVEAAPQQWHATGRALSSTDRLLVVGGVSLFAMYYLLASNMSYVLSDVHRLERATTFAGVLITVVYGSAVVATIVSGFARRRAFGTRWMLLAPICMSMVAAELYSPMARLPVVAVSGAVTLGVAFAFFLLAFRNYASRAAQAGAEEWIAIYNNLGNTSALVGFGVMTLLALANGALLRLGLIGLAAAGFALVAWASRERASVVARVETAP